MNNIPLGDYDCQNCSEPSGYSLVCDNCRPKLSISQSKRIMNIWHGLIRLKGEVDGAYQCFHCEEIKEEHQICGDHFPYTKGSRPDLKFDIRNGRPSCQFCNTSGAAKRKQPTQDDFLPFQS